MRFKKHNIKRLLLVIILGISSLHTYADPMIGSTTSVYDSAQKEGLKLTLATSITNDSNIFQLPDAYLGYPKRSDTIKTVQADLNYNKRYGMQTITLDATLSHNQFNNFSYLDNSTSSYKGTWALKIDTHLSGTVGVTQNQSLANFSNTQSVSKILYTTKSHFIYGDWWVTGPWHALSGISANISSNSATVTTQQNTMSNSAYAGISYVSEAQNSISFKRQNTTGSYTNTPLNYVSLVDTGYSILDDMLDFNWIFSGKSTFSGELKHTAMTNEHFSQRDYAGMAGNLNYLWSVSGKSSIRFTAQRNFGQFLTNYSSYNVTDDFAISPAWQLTPKLSLSATFDHANVNYLGAIDGGASTGRKDTTQTVMVGVNWAPNRMITLHTSIQHTNRNSTFVTYPNGYAYYPYQYGDNTINTIGQLSF